MASKYKTAKMQVVVAERVYDFGPEIYKADLALVKIGKVNNKPIYQIVKDKYGIEK